MTLLNKLEQRFGWLAIDSLPVYIVSAQAVMYIWMFVNPESRGWFSLDPMAIQLGREYWRLLTFLFVIPTQNPLFAFLFLYLLYVYGMALEQEWGQFRFSVFYYLGAIGTIVSAFFFGGTEGAFYLNTSLFLAFAAVHPDFVVYFFFILPLKIKWLAWVTWFFLIRQLWVSPWDIKMALIVSLANYFLFFSKSHLDWVIGEVRRIQHKRRFKDWSR